MGFLSIIYVQCCTGSWRKRFSKPIHVYCTWTCKKKAKLSMKYYKIWNILVFVQKKLTNYLSICAFCRLLDTCINIIKVQIWRHLYTWIKAWKHFDGECMQAGFLRQFEFDLKEKPDIIMVIKVISSDLLHVISDLKIRQKKGVKVHALSCVHH